jgi:hypothetical protein
MLSPKKLWSSGAFGFGFMALFLLYRAAAARQVDEVLYSQQDSWCHAVDCKQTEYLGASLDDLSIVIAGRHADMLELYSKKRAMRVKIPQAEGLAITESIYPAPPGADTNGVPLPTSAEGIFAVRFTTEGSSAESNCVIAYAWPELSRELIVSQRIQFYGGQWRFSDYTSSSSGESLKLRWISNRLARICVANDPWKSVAIRFDGCDWLADDQSYHAITAPYGISRRESVAELCDTTSDPSCPHVPCADFIQTDYVSNAAGDLQVIIGGQSYNQLEIYLNNMVYRIPISGATDLHKKESIFLVPKGARGTPGDGAVTPGFLVRYGPKSNVLQGHCFPQRDSGATIDLPTDPHSPFGDRLVTVCWMTNWVARLSTPGHIECSLIVRTPRGPKASGLRWEQLNRDQAQAWVIWP